MAAAADRFGLSWRPALAAEVWLALEHIDLFEVMAEDFLAPAAWPKLKALRRERPLVVHGVGLGLASSFPVDPQRLEYLARLVEHLAPEGWSEHLAFVRADGIELHHLAAPPRNEETLAGLVRNVAHARAIVGSLPALENVASLVTPLFSTMDEPTWARRVYAATGAPVLLDLHNLWANATTFGWDPASYLAALPPGPLAIHLAGGRRVGKERVRILDDHLHAVPPAVFDLLAEVAARRPEPLTVTLERDGAWPPFAELVAELDEARAAVRRGRARAAA